MENVLDRQNEELGSEEANFLYAVLNFEFPASAELTANRRQCIQTS